jgi:hypothetical protein
VIQSAFQGWHAFCNNVLNYFRYKKRADRTTLDITGLALSPSYVDSFSWSPALIESNDGHLESELTCMMQEQPKPLNLEEIFSLLYDRRERLPQLMAMTRERTLELRRLKRNLDQSVYRGVIQTVWENGQLYYTVRKRKPEVFASSFQLSIVREDDRIAFASRPHRFQVASSRNDRLLTIFCIIALCVLASIGFFLIRG